MWSSNMNMSNANGKKKLTDNKGDIVMNNSIKIVCIVTLFVTFFHVINSYAQNERKIRVLVAYTEAVANANADVYGFVDAFINTTNLILNNSDDNIIETDLISVEVVCIVRVTTNENCNNLRTLFDSFRVGLPTVSGINTDDLRDIYGADACLLLVDCPHAGLGSFYCRDPKLQNDLGGYNLITISLLELYPQAFAHEWGHNLGCHHENSQVTNPYFNHGHAYHSGNAFSTIMFSTANPSLINYYSNPNVQWNGYTIGTQHSNYNARVVDGRIDLPNRNDGYPNDPGNRGEFIDDGVTQASLTLPSETIHFGDYRHAIAGSNITIPSGFKVEGGARFAATICGQGGMPKKVGHPGKKYGNFNEKRIDGYFATLSVKNNAIALRYKMPYSSDVHLKMYAADGRCIKAISLGRKGPGTYTEFYNYPIEASGVYYVEFKAGAYTKRSSVMYLR